MTAEGHSRSDEDEEEQLLRFQIDEIESKRAHSKGKQREGTPNDFEVAMGFFLDEIQSLAQFKDDRRMAKSMAVAVLGDDPTIASLVDQETAARADRNFALAMAGRNEGTNNEIARDNSQNGPLMINGSTDASFLENMRRSALKENLNNDTLEQYSANLFSYRITSEAESSTTAANREKQSEAISSLNPTEERECTACTDGLSILNLAKLPCGHDYCRRCITKLFIDSMVDESLFPPRCCRSKIVLQHVQMFVDADVAAEFKSRKEELETANKTYCRECSTFISKNAIHDNIGNCRACGTSTCCICKERSHEGMDCPNDEALNAFLETARYAGWRACYACRRIVELVHGCNHITCRCGAQFCYECGAQWRTCQCEQWSEELLLGRARRIQQRQQEQQLEMGGQEGLPHPGLDPEQDLGRIVADLRANHNCNHKDWEYISGSHECEECADTLPEYIFQCQQCSLRACWRCRMNRL